MQALVSEADPNPQPQNQTLFTKGQEVEVSSDEDGFKGSWFSCTIVELPSASASASRKRKKAIVRYKSLLYNNRRGPLKEHVDLSYIRPSYPLDKSGDGVFEVNDVVEAYCLEGWWIGVVTKVLDGSRYRVYFDNPPDVIDFDANQLRYHLNWDNGVWVRPEKSQQLVGSDYGPGTEVEVNFEEGDVRETWYTAVVIKDNGDDTFFVKYETPKDWKKVSVGLVHIRPTPPKYVDRDYELLEKVETRWEQGDVCWRAGLITKLLAGRRYNVFFKKFNSERELDHSRLRPHAEWVVGKWICKSKEDMMVSDDQEQLNNLCTPEVTTKLGSSGAAKNTNKEIDPSIGNAMGQSNNSDKNLASDSCRLSKKKLKVIGPHGNLMKSTGDANGVAVQLSTSALKLHDVPVETPTEETLHSLTTGETTRKRSRYQLKPAAKAQFVARRRTVEATLSKDVRSSQRRKRGRPHKFVGPKTPEAGKDDNVAGETVNEVVVKSQTTIEVVPEQTGLDFEDCMKGEVEKAVAGVPNHVADDDKPLSTWFVGHSLTGIEDHRLRSVRPANGLNERRQNELVVMESHAISVRDNNLLDANQCLPFAKRSPVWRTIDSIEVFQIVPQKPHFHPLAECKEEYREGTAIGMMVTFASLFEKIASMRFDDSRSIYDSTLESLLDLERHGFDVTLPRGRINEMLSIKDGQEELLNESRDAEKQMTDLAEEKRYCDEEMHGIEKKIAELNEELAQCKAKMEAKNLEISRLKLHLDSVNGRINSGQHDFVKVATAPWKLC